MQKIQIKDIPDKIIEEIQKEIEPYVVTLLDPNITEERIPLLASGTLVQINDKYCILTARHVTNKLRKLEKIGLNLGTFEHRFAIDTSTLNIIELNNSDQASIAPDLAVIILPETMVGTIKAKKLFWNLTNHRKTVLSEPIDWKNGLFFFGGVIGEWAKIQNSVGQFSKTLSCCCLFGYTGVEKYYSKRGFDYLELSVLYQDRNDLPLSFGGVSGSGVWRVQLYRSNDETINYSKPLLLGVAFRQTAIENNLRSIIGHGWRSIYEKVVEVFEKHSTGQNIKLT